MDFQKLSKNEETIYLLVAKGEDVKVNGNKGSLILQQSNHGNFEVFNPKHKEVTKELDYLIEALRFILKQVGEVKNWEEQ